MQISERGIKFIESFEGFVNHIYDDGTGVLTIGYGTTAADFSPLPTHCTQPQAEQWLRDNLARRYEPAVRALGIPLNQNQYDALTSLAYNCGPGVFGWQIGVDLRNRNYSAAANDFLRYVYAGGRVLQGLVRRRQAEKAMFMQPVPDPAPHASGLFNGSFSYNHDAQLVTVKGTDGDVKGWGAVTERIRLELDLEVGEANPKRGQWSGRVLGAESA